MNVSHPTTQEQYELLLTHQSAFQAEIDETEHVISEGDSEIDPLLLEATLRGLLSVKAEIDAAVSAWECRVIMEDPNRQPSPEPTPQQPIEPEERSFDGGDF